MSEKISVDRALLDRVYRMMLFPDMHWPAEIRETLRVLESQLGITESEVPSEEEIARWAEEDEREAAIERTTADDEEMAYRISKL